MPGVEDRAGAGVLACETENRAAWAWFWSGIKTMNGEAGGDMRGGVYMVVEVVEGRDGEIDPGGRFWPAKPKTEPHGLGFGLGLKQ